MSTGTALTHAIVGADAEASLLMPLWSVIHDGWAALCHRRHLVLFICACAINGLLAESLAAQAPAPPPAPTVAL